MAINKEFNGTLLKDEVDFVSYSDWVPYLVFIEERKVKEVTNTDLSDIFNGIEVKVNGKGAVSYIYLRDNSVLKTVFETLDCLDGVYDHMVDGTLEELWGVPVRYDVGVAVNEVIVISKKLMWNKDKGAGCYAAKLIVEEEKVEE